MPQRNKVTDIYEPPLTEAWCAFVQYVAALLGAKSLFRCPSSRRLSWNDAGWLRRAAVAGDLVLVQPPESSWVQRLLTRTSVHRFVAQTQSPVLVARQPRCPFERLLLVLRDEAADEPAIRWTLHLAGASGARVTILPVVPSLPVMYVLGSRGQPELDVLLSPNTPIGSKIRQVGAALTRAGISWEIRQQRGKPDWQIRQELADGAYDLLVIGAESGGRLYRWFVGELVPPLLRWSTVPVLIARHVAVDGA